MSRCIKHGSGLLGAEGERQGERLAVVGFWKFMQRNIGRIPVGYPPNRPTAFLRTLPKNRALAGRVHPAILNAPILARSSSG
jgi:hypothetical protein